MSKDKKPNLEQRSVGGGKSITPTAPKQAPSKTMTGGQGGGKSITPVLQQVSKPKVEKEESTSVQSDSKSK